ncbi:GerAB/ArcD/ProY family transporter [Alkalihalobacillus trypoxylicola]|uniref:Spore gernimation protein GerB n=1 Tax=Alkalihalobacillus trypoxylicola TaxID=519424 RepID=A0A162EKX4_9BACI|nr:GerAB/ArcD/ProY family transporter [Alkalihalobacillus trypoxylicola]KYG33150.1 spore gernimation protein GerB [Alkalihalobacillus trypoxylicola]
MAKEIKEQYLVSGFLSFFIIHSMQFGVGVLGFQRNLVKITGYDGWISVIIAGILVSLSIALMYVLLKKADGDIIHIHMEIFGKWVGGFLSLLIGAYFLALAVIIIRTYIEVVQVWVFEDVSTIFFSVLTIPFCYYVVSGGFRTVVGLSFISTIVIIPLFPLFLMPLEFAHYLNILPIWKHSVFEIFEGAKSVIFSYSGFELLLIYYPFLKNRQFSQKWTQAGAIFTTLTYTYITLVSLFFYSEEQLNKTIWGTLTLFKVIEFPFLERFEYVGVTLWLVLIVPNIALAIWAASRLSKRVFSLNQRHVLVFIVLLVAFLSAIIPTKAELDQIGEIFNQIGFYFAFAYIPLLVLLQFIVYKWKKKKGNHHETTSM